MQALLNNNKSDFFSIKRNALDIYTKNENLVSLRKVNKYAKKMLV